MRSAQRAIVNLGSKAQRSLVHRRPSGDVRLRHLAMTQVGTTLQISISTSGGLQPMGLTAHSGPPDESWLDLALFAPAKTTGETTKSLAVVDLETLVELSDPAQGAEHPATGIADPTGGVSAGIYLRLEGTATAMPRGARQAAPVGSTPVPAPTWPGSVPVITGRELAAAVERGEVPGDQRWSGLVPLGRFTSTDIGVLTAIQAGGHVYRPFISRRGSLRVAIDRPLKAFAAVYVDYVSVDDGLLSVKGSVQSRHSDVLAARVVLVGRTTGDRFEAAAQVMPQQKLTSQNFGLHHSALEATIDVAGQSLERLAADDVLDAWLEVTTQDSESPHRSRIGHTSYFVRKSIRAGWHARAAKTVVLTPYFTFKAKRFSLHVDVLDTDAFDLIRSSLRRLGPRHVRSSARPVWLIGERRFKAQDTGLAFFRYLRERHPEIDAYYVIDRTSPEVKNLAGLDHVVWYQSKEHIEVALQAERFIGSHHPEYLYPTWFPPFRDAMRGTKVFLQHGIMGTKWMVPNYGKNAPGFDTDLFLVSSEREKEYIVRDFGYPSEDVIVTGLSRFDSLFADDVPVKPNQVLVIPTWRDWLQDPATFEESDYLLQWMEFIRDPRLRAVAAEHDAEIVLCLHPNMQMFRGHFAEPGVRVITQGEADVQHLIKQSAIMVTDYSSVGFDFAFLGKPVIYFQFDRSRFIGRAGSHIDLDLELPGIIGFHTKSVIDHLTEALESGGSVLAEYTRRAERFLAYRDQNNCERIFSAIQSATPRHPPRHVIDPELVGLASNQARKSSVYYPAMRRLTSLWRRLPMDDELILFESGVGKQYADSPRYIYEELLRRGDPRKKVWAYDGRLPIKDPHTVTVKRLSPKYFWYLSRAKYWVNNQNFPHYIRRRRDGVFIQTWHGTPLKRMQHDVAEVHGRDPGYLDRVTTAMQQWSVLLSPSPYATKAFRSAFRYEGTVLEAGYPRNDVLADPDRGAAIRDAVRRRFGLGPTTKTILYAPTFRDDQPGSRSGRFRFDLPFELADFAAAFDDDTVLLLRMHVLIENKISIPWELRDRVIDASFYPEIQDLYLASDVLVTDYSSTFFDYAILGRPIIFFAYDLDRYRDQLRGFYLDYSRELPGPIVTDPSDLWNALRSALDPGPDDLAGVVEFAATFAPNDDGQAARRVVDELL